MSEGEHYLLFSQRLLETIAEYVLHYSLANRPQLESDRYYFEKLYAYLSLRPSTTAAAEILLKVSREGGGVTIFALDADIPEQYEFWAAPCDISQTRGKTQVTRLHAGAN